MQILVEHITFLFFHLQGPCKSVTTLWHVFLPPPPPKKKELLKNINPRYYLQLIHVEYGVDV